MKDESIATINLFEPIEERTTFDTIALRYGENFAPKCGTIAAHQEIIDKIGHVWFGKLGRRVSTSLLNRFHEEPINAILLVGSGTVERYWAYVIDAMRETPTLNEIPEYYRHRADDFNSWFKISKFERASKDVLSRCTLLSSGKLLSNAARHSMGSCFVIKYTANPGLVHSSSASLDIGNAIKSLK